MKNEVLLTHDLAIGYQNRRLAKEAEKHGRKYPGKVVADNLSLDLAKGELVCLLGPNGSGKSTLMRTIAGVQKPLGGHVTLDGRSLERLSTKETARLLSLVLTDRVMTGNLSVYALVALGRYPYTGWMGKLSKDDETVVREAIAITGTRRFACRHISDLSDGERQKVMIARALAQDTPVILLDEPTAHLDLPNRIEVVRLLKQLARERGKSIVMSTHELDLALQAADRIWLMSPVQAEESGKNIEMISGMPEELILDGRLEKAFKRNGFEFDRESGSFRINQHHEGCIGLVGEGTLAYWTKRALERIGYKVVIDASLPCRIEVSEDRGNRWWRYYNGKSGEPFEIQDIGSVISCIKKNKTDSEIVA
ncbi:ABC transporter ATP-binding protein [Prosthecochloris sp. SCSIO W1101]|uniref:ABC transporter ATP-binding protein n=1 Tax=Prosthecochloris sp. SCSIO W1101 TaxID=2992242 RepID=UPI00223D4118|nr:ABC transporter ATP-binding protein [Prosthecochloris sp. SCSIO W1101]UZJ40183.1 ABC transporter ATP-binding protein [Prosthecochloris sp. SCSIO W1101]